MRALVTGAGGHLGFNLVSLLRAKGHEVRATLRSGAHRLQAGRLQALGAVDIVEADVRHFDQIRAALDQVDVLFHAAAVYSITDGSRDSELLDTARAGTEAVLRAAAASGVSRVVMTSSVVTLPLTLPGDPPSTEQSWNTDLRIPYFRGKVESERKAWALPEVIAATVSGKVYNYSTERARRELGWVARVPFEQSLRDTLDEIRRLGEATR